MTTTRMVTVYDDDKVPDDVDDGCLCKDGMTVTMSMSMVCMSTVRDDDNDRL